MILPSADESFFYAALHQLDPAVRPTFLARVAASLAALRDPGPGDVDRAIRAALIGLCTPLPDNLGQLEPRWARRRGRDQARAQGQIDQHAKLAGT